MRNRPFGFSLPCAVPALGALAWNAGGCSGNDPPSGPRVLTPPTYVFTPGQRIMYIRQNFDQNYLPPVDYMITAAYARNF